MAQLVRFIKHKLEQEGLSAYALEKRAGLKPSAVNNIIYGKSKNPSISVLKAISKALNCTVADLIGEETYPPQANQIATTSISIPQDTFQNHELYTNCLLTFCSALKKRKLWLSKELILNCVDEIYLFSTKKGLKNIVDHHFVDWMIEKNCKI